MNTRWPVADVAARWTRTPTPAMGWPDWSVMVPVIAAPRGTRIDTSAF